MPEFNKYKFSCDLIEVYTGNNSKWAFKIEGLKVVKKPEFKRVPRYQIDNVSAKIARRSLKDVHTKIFSEVQEERAAASFS